MRTLRAAAATAALALIAGCAFAKPCDLHDKVYGVLCVFESPRQRPTRDNHGVLTGSVHTEPPPTNPIVVFVYQLRGGREEIVGVQTLEPHGPYGFSFTVPEGDYRLAAFEDGGRDFRYDPVDERAALYHEGSPIVLTAGRTVDRLYLRLRTDLPQYIDFDVMLADPAGDLEVSESR